MCATTRLKSATNNRTEAWQRIHSLMHRNLYAASELAWDSFLEADKKYHDELRKHLESVEVEK